MLRVKNSNKVRGKFISVITACKEVKRCGIPVHVLSHNYWILANAGHRSVASWIVDQNAIDFCVFIVAIVIGEEFVCVGRRGVPGESVYISLSEETAELVIRWRGTGMYAPLTLLTTCMPKELLMICNLFWHTHNACAGVTETVDLLQVKTRKGFSHRGRLNSGKQSCSPKGVCLYMCIYVHLYLFMQLVTMTHLGVYRCLLVMISVVKGHLTSEQRQRGRPSCGWMVWLQHTTCTNACWNRAMPVNFSPAMKAHIGSVGHSTFLKLLLLTPDSRRSDLGAAVANQKSTLAQLVKRCRGWDISQRDPWRQVLLARFVAHSHASLPSCP